MMKATPLSRSGSEAFGVFDFIKVLALVSSQELS